MCPTSTAEPSRAGARACAAAALAGALLVAACGDEVRQPIEYSHRLHVSELSLGCDHCHESSHLGDVAGLPALAVCAECHQEAIGTSTEERKVVAAIAAGKEIRWGRLYDLPRHVFFTHRRHVTSAGIACERCHGPMGAQARPPRVPLVPLSMEACLSCHRERGATLDCAGCHR
jgi:hypothetical protein